jgi:hypothetical protein
VLRRIFGPKMNGVTGGRRKLHNEVLRDLYSSPSTSLLLKSRRMRWAGHIARMGEKRNVYTLLVGSSYGKRPVGRPRRRWVDDIPTDIREIGWGGMDWTNLVQNYIRYMVMNITTASVV